MIHKVKTEPTFDAEAVFVGRTFSSIDILDAAVLHLEAHLAADAAEWADAAHFAVVVGAVTDFIRIKNRRRHQRPGGAGLDALAARHAGRLAHRVREIEDDLGVMASSGHADDIIHLHFTARPHTKPAMNARIEIDPHRWM